MQRKHYDSDLNDREWKTIPPLIPVNQEPGRKMTLKLREVLNAIFYVVRTGCQWRALPGDFPNWSSVYYPAGVRNLLVIAIGQELLQSLLLK